MDHPQESNNHLPLAGTKILLAEDTTDHSRLFLQFLQTAGADVTLECNGQSAVNAVRRATEQFDAIVMDFQMPDMDGLLATRRIRGLGFEGAIIAVTACATYELAASWSAAGCDDYIEKPFRKQQLVGTVQRQLAARQTATPTVATTPEATPETSTT